MIKRLWNILSCFFILTTKRAELQLSTQSLQSLNFSNIKFLGLFGNTTDSSELKEFSLHCRAMFKTAVLLSYQYNFMIDRQFLGWEILETSDDIMETFRNSCQAVSAENIVGIVGPVYSRQVDIIAAFSEKVSIPIISYSATAPDLADRIKYPAFYRTVASDDHAALSMAQLFLKFNWTSCVMIYQNDAYGSGAANAIVQTFNESGLQVIQSIPFDTGKMIVRGNLKVLLLNSITRIVILWAEPRYASIIVQSALELDVIGPLFTWILSTTIPLTSFSPTFYPKLAGMLTIEPTTANILNEPFNQTLLNDAYRIWQQYEPQSFPGAANVNTYALFAFDAAWAFIQVLTDYCSSSTSNASSSCIEFIRSSNCFDVRSLNSTSLFNRMNNISFLGVSGLVQFSSDVTNRIGGIYYLANNIQTVSNTLNYVPVLKWSYKNGWRELQQSATIVWPGNTLEPPRDRASLKNVSLRICVIESIPFTILTTVDDDSGQNGSTKLTGYIPDLIDLLQNTLQFIPYITLAPSNQSYSSLVDAVAEGVYDIVVADLTITAARREKVTFSSSIFDDSLTMLMREKTADHINLVAYLAPFSLHLWLVLLGASIFAAFLVCVLERVENRVLNHRSFISAVTMSWWYSISTIMGYGADFHAITAAGRLLTAGLYLLSLVLVATYTANLASDLTLSKSKYMISGIDDIKNGKVPFNRVGVQVGTAAEDYYLREITQGNKNYHSLTSPQHTYHSLLNNVIDVALMDSGIAEYATNTIYCNLTLVGQDVDENPFGIVMQKNWIYKEDLDIAILSLRESGDIDDLRQKWFDVNNCPDSSDDPTGMTIEMMSGLFLTFAVICVLSLLFFMWTNRSAVKTRLFNLLGRHCPIGQQSSSSDQHTSKKSRRSINTQPFSLNGHAF